MRERIDIEERTYKFDARLRYVENLINSWIMFIQANSDKESSVNWNIRDKEAFNSSLLNLYYLLKIHDPDLKKPNVDDKDFSYLINHNLIKELTENKLKSETIEEQIDKDYE